MTYLRIFLKVCEGCGSLWFRTQDSPEVYCSGCSARMRSLPQARRSRRPGRRGNHGARKAGGAA
jgi:hypothetical protein